MRQYFLRPNSNSIIIARLISKQPMAPPKGDKVKIKAGNFQKNGTSQRITSSRVEFLKPSFLTENRPKAQQIELLGEEGASKAKTESMG
jgi:hypothetical protein